MTESDGGEALSAAIGRRPAPYYADELVSLYLGDCLEVLPWLSADVLITDPPYGIGYRQKIGAYAGAGSQVLGDRIAGDADTAVRDEVLRRWGARPAMVFGSWRIRRPAELRALLIWHKLGAHPGPANAAFMSNHEEIYVLGDGWIRTAPPLRSVLTTREQRTLATRAAEHPTPKPVGLMQVLIGRAPAGIIADPFAGSGSTLEAAKALGRRAVGVEIDERHCERTARRLAQDPLFYGGAG